MFFKILGYASIRQQKNSIRSRAIAKLFGDKLKAIIYIQLGERINIWRQTKRRESKNNKTCNACKLRERNFKRNKVEVRTQMPPGGDGGAKGGGGGGCSSHLARTLLLFLLWHTLTTISLLHSHPSPLPYDRRRRAPPPPLARPHHHQPLRYTLQRRFSIINRKEFLIDAGVLKTAPFFSTLFLSLFCYSSRVRGAMCRLPLVPRSFRWWMCRGA